MKKLLTVLICLLVAAGLVLGGWHWYNSQAVQPESVNAPRLGSTELTLTGWDWNVAMLGGLFYKEDAYNTDGPVATAELTLPIEAMAFTAPGGEYISTATLHCGDQVLFSGDVAENPALTDPALYQQPGEYRLYVTSEKPAADGQSFGVIRYQMEFTVLPSPEPPPPEEPERPEGLTFTPGNTALQQGDIFSFKIWNLAGDEAPTVQTDLGLAVCTPLAGGEGDWYCAVPVGNTRAPGSYPVLVSAGGAQWEATVAVEAFAFEEQNLIIDVTDPVIGEANSAAAYQQYREKIPPLFNTYDEDIYWEGTFLQPVEGRITTHFGTIRYTNSDFANPSHHWGLDLAADTGTPVLAPNHGRVILAEYLLNTGNTLVIEYGGGLKSYFFHMDSLNVAEGDMVERGQQVGAVGSTGYSTGPHLHCEMRIGNQAISPEMLFLEGAGLYSAALPAEGAQSLDE